MSALTLVQPQLESFPLKTRPEHPIHYLLDHYFKPLGVPAGDLNALIRVESNVAELLGAWFGTGEDSWLRMQWDFDRWAASEGLSYWEAAHRAQVEYELGLAKGSSAA
jgi:plasmid maintenance system antidote protein VapI